MRALFFINLFLFAGFNAHSTVVITNGLTHIHDMSGRTAEEGTVIIKNIGKDPQRIVMYFEDLEVSCQGKKDYAPAGTLKRSNSKWIKLGAMDKVLHPGQEFPLRYEINSPDSLTGAYWSLLMVEIKNPIDTAELEYGVRIGSNIRYAVQLITNFTPEKALNIEFNNIEIEEEKSGKFIAVNLENQGDLLITPLIKLEVFNENGEVIAEQKADRHKLYPGECAIFKIPFPRLSKGKYQSVVVADCGGELFGTTINLTLDE